MSIFKKNSRSNLYDYFEDIKSKYKPSNKSFQVEIKRNNQIDIQIFHRIALKTFETSNLNYSFGYVILIYFVEGKKKNLESFRNFLKCKYFKEYTNIQIEKFNMYYYDCEENIECLIEMIKDLMTNVYLYKESEKFDIITSNVV